MSSHYIKTEKLLLTKESLEQLCPALGFGETPPDPTLFCVAEGYVDTNNPAALGAACIVEGYILPPDPALFCPAQGYILNPDLPTPPTFTIPVDETNDKIVMICSSELDNAVSFACTISGSSQYYNVKVYNMAGVLQYTSANIQSTATINLNFQTAWGTLAPEGYYLYKVVIASVLVINIITRFNMATRTYYAVTGWPVKELHFYTPSIITTTNISASLLKMMTYVKFYTNCNSITSLGLGFQYCTLLKEVILPPQMNACTSMANLFQYCPALRYVTFPVSMPALTSIASMFAYGGLKKCTPTDNPLPATMAALTSMVSLFDSNQNINELLIPNDLPVLSDMSRLVYNANFLKSFKFTGNVGDPVAGANFDIIMSNNFEIEEMTFPPTFYGRAGGQMTQTQNCGRLKKVNFPTSMTYFVTSLANFSLFGRYNDCVKLIEFTEITSGGLNTVCGQLLLNNTRALTRFRQPLMRVYSASMNATSSNLSALAYFECNWAEIQTSNTLAGSINWTLSYCNFSTTELNRMLTALPVITGGVLATFDIRNNPGYAGCNKAIGTAKGWTVP